MNIAPLTLAGIEQAAEIFTAHYRAQRQSVPSLSPGMESASRVAESLENLVSGPGCTGAFQDGRLVGYLGGWIFDGFRGTPRRAVYCPEWGHGILPGADASRIYRLLYRTASAGWFASGVQVHAITLLGEDIAAREAWFWNGFGLHVLDGIRPMDPLHAALPCGYRLFKAGLEDAQAVARLEAEHWQHYARPPVFMMSDDASSAEECAALIQDPSASFWLACGESDGEPAGYLRFERHIDGSAAILDGEHTIGINGAFVRPQHRGRGISPALLDAALQDYAARGFRRCLVDFESFNPEAAAFWPKYFQMVAYSVVRVPERTIHDDR